MSTKNSERKFKQINNRQKYFVNEFKSAFNKVLLNIEDQNEDFYKNIHYITFTSTRLKPSHLKVQQPQWFNEVQ